MSSSRRAGRRRRKARPTTGEGEAAQLEDFAHRAADLTLESAQALCGQLGYKPVNLVRVGAFMWDNPDEPLVAVLYPLLSNRLGGRYDSTGNVLGIPGWRRKGARSKDGEEEQGVRADNEADPQTRERTDKPFPTMLWMTCPSLHARVCKLEDRGWIQKLDRRLQESPEHIAAMEAAHRAYAAARWALLTDEDRAFVASKDWEEPLRDTGIAGIRNFGTVKCLHCHLAHHLSFPSHGNVVGKWTEDLLAEGEDEEDGSLCPSLEVAARSPSASEEATHALHLVSAQQD